MIVTRGTLRKGCILVAGLAHAKVRGLFDHNNQPIDKVTPGEPVEILGWRELPAAGDIVLEVDTEKKATSVLRHRNQCNQQKKAEEDLDAISAKREEHNKFYQSRRNLTKKEKRQYKPKTYGADDPTPKLNIILKADVHGSLEAILDVCDTYDCSDKCRLNIVHYGVGLVTESDIELAKTFNAVIYGFSIKVPPSRPQGVVMRDFNIIYRLFEDIVDEINNRLPEIEVDDVVGEAKIQQIFLINERNKKVPVLGCRCVKGILKKNLRYKIYRDDQEIFDGIYTHLIAMLFFIKSQLIYRWIIIYATSQKWSWFGEKGRRLWIAIGRQIISSASGRCGCLLYKETRKADYRLESRILDRIKGDKKNFFI